MSEERAAAVVAAPQPAAAPAPPLPIPQVDIDSRTPGGQGMLDLMTFAGMLVRTGLFNRPNVPNLSPILVMRMLAGRTYGLPPLAALDAFQLIEGRISPSASFQLALVGASKRLKIKVRENSAELAAVQWFRDGELVGESTFSIADYKQAQLGQSASGRPGAWQKYPRQMLLYRAFTQGMKVHGAHLLFGIDFAERAEGTKLFLASPSPADRNRELDGDGDQTDVITIAEAVMTVESEDDLGLTEN